MTQRVQQLQGLIAAVQHQIAEYERQLELAQNLQQKTAMGHRLADAQEQLESYEEELVELDPEGSGFSRVAIWTTANFEQEVLQSDVPVLIDFWAEWCGPCKQLSPMIEELAHELAGAMRFGKLNVDEEPQIASRLDVQSLPTLLVLHNRRVVDVISGSMSYGQLRARLENIVQHQ